MTFTTRCKSMHHFLAYVFTDNLHLLSTSYVFRWLAIPWLQAELDAWAHRRNHNAPRRDKNKILPHGIPAIIRAKPHEFNSLDFKVSMSSMTAAQHYLLFSRFQCQVRSLMRSKQFMLPLIILSSILSHLHSSNAHNISIPHSATRKCRRIHSGMYIRCYWRSSSQLKVKMT